MNEDYLWNRTGSDSEIERLENALKPLRFAGSVPPRLPAKVAERNKASRRGFFGFWLAPAFAAVAVAIVALAVYWPASRVTNIATGPVDSPVPSAKTAVTKPEEHPAPITVPPVQKPAPIVTLYKVPKRRTPRPTNLVAVKSVRKAPQVKLTKEEEYAYSQLMLALAITSSKLKIVKDTLDGPDARTMVPIKEKDAFRK